MITLFLAALTLTAQQQPARATMRPGTLTAGGTVVLRSGPDSLPTAGVRVLLHRVGQNAQGPVDSTVTDPAGRFTVRFAADTGALYLVSARYRGIEYFAPPLSRDPRAPDLGVRIVVFDTSSSVPLTVASRHFVVGAPGTDGSRNVADLILLENAGALTRVVGDSSTPTWRIPLPRGASGVEVGESDFAADAVVMHADTALVFASIPPGRREFTLTYRIAPGSASFEIPVSSDIPEADLLSEESGLKIRGGLAFDDTVTVISRRFTKWTGSLKAGVPLRLEFPGVRSVPGWVLPLLIAVLGLGLLGIGVVSNRRESRLAPAPNQGNVSSAGAAAERLIDQLAELDIASAGLSPGGDAERWQQYQRERARLKAELASLLPR